MMDKIRPYLEKKAKAAKNLVKIDPKEGIDGLRRTINKKLAEDDGE